MVYSWVPRVIEPNNFSDPFGLGDTSTRDTPVTGLMDNVSVTQYKQFSPKALRGLF